ncbi:MAG TPA: uroporphyrinogen decarboxylase family protein [Clostridia bacterium]|nr:uroporphyrinogen decarboxylase family protein [Clostridia bacterium]
MSDFNPQELLKERMNRMEKTIRLEETDRTPICFLLGISGFQARNAGFTMADVSHDYNKFVEAVVKLARDFEHDYAFSFPGLANMITHTMVDDHPEVAGPFGLITGPTHDILQDNYSKWPGRELDDNAAPQFRGGKFLEIDEYQQFIDNPKKCINEVILPRAYGCLEKPNSGKAYGAFIKLGIDITQFGAAMAKLGEELRKIGYPQAMMAAIVNPYDLIADFVRHFDNTIMDFYRAPDKLQQAAEAILPYTLKFADTALTITPELRDAYDFENPLVFYPQHLNEFLSPELYKKYVWPSLKKLMEADIKVGRVPLVFFEGDHTHHLETLLEIPKGKMIAYFERPNWEKVAEIVGGHQCVMGGVPPSMLISGTPDSVSDHIKKMVDMFEGRGLILSYSQSSLPVEVKEENLKAAVETVKSLS